MLSELARFEPFQTYGMSELQLLAAHTRIVEVPAERWLLRRGRRLSGQHYLLRGVLLTWSPDGVVEAGGRQARQPVCPGPVALKTLTDCRLLQISEAGLELAATRVQAELVTVTESEVCWQTRFLDSHLMTGLRPETWQRVLSRLQPDTLAEGSWVLREGADGSSHCCLLASGSAVVSRAGVVLARLAPGDLFGEDALIAGSRRNASVRMLEPGVVMRLAAADFSRFLVDVLGDGVFHPSPGAPAASRGAQAASRTVLRVASATRLRERLAHLDPSLTYLVSSADPSVQALTLFLLRKRGISAWAAPG